MKQYLKVAAIAVVAVIVVNTVIKRVPRAEYIRRAIVALNAQVTAEQRRRRMMEVSRRVRGESMRVNAEFDAVSARGPAHRMRFSI